VRKNEQGIIQVDGREGAANLAPLQFKRFTVSLTQHLGDRRTQEDRFVICPDLVPGLPGSDEQEAFFGVFDGTVGDFASDTVKDIIVNVLKRQRGDGQDVLEPEALKRVMVDTYKETDRHLLHECARHQQHYATSTAVTLYLAGDYLVVSHLGDSRIAIQFENEGKLESKFVTVDHKPDQERERCRIEDCGGMVERLVNHNNKPFIRGGDFMMRKALGEQPMQLQYSRAFGAKDLKMFGLSSTPEPGILALRPQVRMAILASDGLWDVLTADQATELASKAIAERVSPSQYLVSTAIQTLRQKGARADNITVLVVQFN
jgi:protein phosphatase